MLTYDIPALRQTGSRNLMGSKTLPTIWGTYMKLVTKYQISAINSCWKYVTKNVHICSMCIKTNKVGKQEVGIWWVQKCFTRYGVPIWSLWPYIRFLPSIVAEKNVTKNVHICSMCIKTNKVGKQEVGIWRVQKRFPQYGIPIWSLWPNIRFLPSTVTEKSATKNILDGRTEVKQYTPLPNLWNTETTVQPYHFSVQLQPFFRTLTTHLKYCLGFFQNVWKILWFENFAHLRLY